jgi:RNA polymerase sigma factor (sigma-70 family)
MDESTSQSQIQAFFRGDEKVIRSLYDSVFFKVKTFILQNNGSVKDSEEIFQDAIYQLIVRSKVKEVHIKTSLEAYIFTICKFSWYKELNNRKKWVRNEGVFELKDETEHHVEAILNQERWDLFEEMLLKLSDNCQKLLKDFFNKVSYDVIIEKFNYTTKNVAFQRIFKCKKKLTALIKADQRYKDL